MDIDVDRLARRPDGPRLLLYLDQSTLSALVTEKNHAGLLDLLRAEVGAGRLLCPTSISHEDETARIHIRDRRLWQEIDGLADELSIGIGFRGEEEIEVAEIDANLEQMISWKLGPVLAPEEFRDQYLKRGFALAGDAEAAEFDISPGSAYNRFMAFGTRRIQMERLAESYPEIARRPDEFRQFEPLRSLPTLAFPALFRAALAARTGRRARLSDGHDIAHLTHGLSRCDLVTADAGMAQLIKDFKLAPAGCLVFSYREFDQLATQVEQLLAER